MTLVKKATTGRRQCILLLMSGSSAQDVLVAYNYTHFLSHWPQEDMQKSNQNSGDEWVASGNGGKLPAPKPPVYLRLQEVSHFPDIQISL